MFWHLLCHRIFQQDNCCNLPFPQLQRGGGRKHAVREEQQTRICGTVVALQFWQSARDARRQRMVNRTETHCLPESIGGQLGVCRSGLWGRAQVGTVNNRRTRMSTDGMATRTRAYNCCAAPTCTSGGRPKGNISGGEITRNGKRSAKMPTFLMPLRLASVVGKRRRWLFSIVNRPKTQQSLLPFDTQTKFLGYLNR